MTAVVCLGAGALDYPEGKGGGHTWVFLNWALGLRSLGCRVIWLESAPPRTSVDVTRARLTILKRLLEPYGFEEIALASSNGEPPARQLADEYLSCADAAAEADLLLDLGHNRSPTVVDRFSRSAFVDIDPGLLQLWMEAGETSGADYDRYFTIGETVGTARARFPDCGLTWIYTPPPVFLEEWAVTPSASEAAYTTVTHLYAGTVEIDGQEVNNDKRTAFLQYLDLPSRTPQRLELALCLGTDDAEDAPLFERAGWRVRDAWDLTATPQDYAAYISSSRGEFSCAKPSCLLLENAWISDRTICYLASGKPAVVQYTGTSRFLPDAEGLFRFRTIDEAAAMLEEAESEYERHSRAARTLAEEHFDARKVVARVLEQALSSGDAVEARRPRRWVHPTATSGADAPPRRRRRERVDVPCDRVNHPVVRAWRTIAPAGMTVDRAARIYTTRRGHTQTFRLVLREGATSVIAKRARNDVLHIERTIYESVLPRLPLSALRYFGFVDAEEGEFGWLFIEDAGDDRYALAQHRRLAAGWLGTLHGAAAELDLPSSLPERGTDHYLEHLLATSTAILDNLDNPALRADDRDMLRALVATCELIESGWGRVEAICSVLPETLVHGDLVDRHLRLRRDDAGPTVVAFDWEWSGRGVPAADIHLLLEGATRDDLSCYRSAICEHMGGRLDDDELQALLLVGNGFRLLACADWASMDLPCPQPEYGVESLYLYGPPLRAWAAALKSAA